MSENEFSEPTERWLAAGRHIDVAGMRIFVYERGAGPTVLFLHGFPTACIDWRDVIEAVSAGYRCVALDFPGYGLSEKPAAYSYSLFQQTDVVERLAEALGIAEAHVVGHDVGQTVHAELLARENEGRLPFRVLSNTILNGSTLMDKATITPFQTLLSVNATLPQAIAICEKVGSTYIDGLKGVMKRPEALSEDDATALNEMLLYQEGNRRIPALATYMRERLLHMDRWIGAFKAAKAPTQIIWADGDPVANIGMGRALRDLLPGARYTELAGVGHFLPTEAPDEVAGAILYFLREVSA